MPNFNSRETVRLVIDEYDKALNDPEVGRLVPRIIDRCVQVLDSALTAHARAAVEEAADRYCSLCPGDGVEDCNRSTCADRAAILGREVER